LIFADRTEQKRLFLIQGFSPFTKLIKRLETLAKLAGSKKTVRTGVEFVDIAGLVRGASKGEGIK
jgi:ribosome-binding ATPase YchF (GTP1/OBG family)